MVEKLPAELAGSLPTVAEIEAELADGRESAEKIPVASEKPRRGRKV